jgi:ethanolamine ammonia-lyase small subunit
LLVSSNAVAAKLRQLLPALQAHLNNKGLGVTSIRIKVQNR